MLAARRLLNKIAGAGHLENQMPEDMFTDRSFAEPLADDNDREWDLQ